MSKKNIEFEWPLYISQQPMGMVLLKQLITAARYSTVRHQYQHLCPFLKYWHNLFIYSATYDSLKHDRLVLVIALIPLLQLHTFTNVVTVCIIYIYMCVCVYVCVCLCVYRNLITDVQRRTYTLILPLYEKNNLKVNGYDLRIYSNKFLKTMIRNPNFN